jgi:hypothetical protein
LDIKSTKLQLEALVKKMNAEDFSLTLEVHQQKVKKTNMCVRGGNGALWIEPLPNWYDIGLSGQSLTNQMTGYMEKLCGAKTGNKQSKPEPGHQPFWRVTDFKYVEAAVREYPRFKK